MPFDRPTLTGLRQRVAASVTASLGAAGSPAPLLRFSNLNIVVKVQAGLVHGCYGYLDWIAAQSTPFTATEPSYIARWGALRGVAAKPATAAVGFAIFTGVDGGAIASGTPLVRPDGFTYLTTADAVIAGGSATAPIAASAVGSAGLAVAGVQLALTSPIANVAALVTVAADITAGLDAETPVAFRSRVLQRFAQPPQGGSRGDFVAWTTALAGVTRAWVRPSGFGPGTLVVYAMFDQANVAHDGLPQGTDGVASGEERGAAATGDQLVVANALLPLQPAEALVYVCAPIAAPQDFAITGMPVALRTATRQAIADLMASQATSPGGVATPAGTTAGLLSVSAVFSAIAAATGVLTFRITAPTEDIQTGTGEIATLGAVSFA